MSQLRLLLVITAALLTAPLALATSATAAKPGAAERVCDRAIAVVERARGLPPRLLNAIALVETGRWDADRRAGFAWPWTVYAQGRGRFFTTKPAAMAAVARLQAAGVRNIDVGCMQVNLRHHPDAFAGLEQAFDPLRNVAYAADFLKELRRTTRSWSRAVAQYHSATRARGRPYWQKVLATWNRDLRRYYRARRAAYVHAYRARRARRLAAR